MIRKVEGGFKVLSEDGKTLGGPYPTRAAAEKRLRQVEWYKVRDAQKQQHRSSRRGR